MQFAHANYTLQTSSLLTPFPSLFFRAYRSSSKGKRFYAYASYYMQCEQTCILLLCSVPAMLINMDFIQKQKIKNTAVKD